VAVVLGHDCGAELILRLDPQRAAALAGFDTVTLSVADPPPSTRRSAPAVTAALPSPMSSRRILAGLLASRILTASVSDCTPRSRSMTAIDSLPARRDVPAQADHQPDQRGHARTGHEAIPRIGLPVVILLRTLSPQLPQLKRRPERHGLPAAARWPPGYDDNRQRVLVADTRTLHPRAMGLVTVIEPRRRQRDAATHPTSILFVGLRTTPMAPERRPYLNVVGVRPRPDPASLRDQLPAETWRR
jgi:hypothetical protein